MRSLLLLALIGAVVSTPLTRSRDEVERYRNFLKRGSSQELDPFKAQAVPSPKHPEMYSGKFEGDIVLDEDQIEAMVDQFAARNAIIFPGWATQWPNNTIIWKIADTHLAEPGEREALFSAMKLVESRTCVKFQEAGPLNGVYVNITSYPNGCYASLGYRMFRNSHTLNLGSSPGMQCYRQPTIVHELMHVMGFLHMHSTHNRNEYVRIQYENVVPGAEREFDFYNHLQVGNLLVEYDYLSCLHYPALAWSKNFEPTIVNLKDVDGEMGQRDYVTEEDWLRINRYHNCTGAWNNFETRHP